MVHQSCQCLSIPRLDDQWNVETELALMFFNSMIQ
jgi:hypothetical protein